MPSEQPRRRFLASLGGVASVGVLGAVARSASTADAQRAGRRGSGRAGSVDRGTDTVTPRTTSRSDAVWTETLGTLDDKPIGAVPAHGEGAALLVSPRETDYGLRVVQFLHDGTTDVDARIDAPEWYEGWFVRTDDGYVAVTHASDESRPWILSLGPDGERRWDSYIELGSALEPNSTASGRRPNGGVVVGGGMGEDEDRVAWAVGTDSDGDREWFRTYSFDGFDVHDVSARHDGGYLFVGESRPPSVEGTVPALLATNESGREEWRRTLAGYAEGALRVFPRSGGAAILGEIFDHDRQEVVLSVVDDRGSPVWRRRFEGLAPTDFVPLDEGFAVATRTRLFGTDRIGRRDWDRTFEYEDMQVVTATEEQLFVAGQVDSMSRGGSPEMWAAGVSLPES
ncbi:hypothetical protein [Halosimplex sp. TS25]|uniref:hypothetical protein n=1 Tax=Halosimplex rarum TaxID=3396619 RepID=UPI0039EA9659